MIVGDSLSGANLASFPGSPHPWTKNWGKPGRIYQTRNDKGRENLLHVGEWINLPTLCWQYTRSVLKALWLTEWDCTVLRYISWQYGKLWQAYIGPYVHKITLNLLAYLANWPGEWFPRCCKTLRWLFPRLCLSLPRAYCLKKKKLPEQAPTKTQLQVHAWAHQWSAYAQLSCLYLLFTCYVRW